MVKNKRSLSLMLAYVFILTILPMNLFVEQVQATGLWVSKYGESVSLNYDSDQNSNYKYNEMHVSRLDRDNKLSLVIDRSDDHEGYKIIKLNPDGTSNELEVTSEDLMKRYLGVFSGKLYYLKYDGVGISVNTMDLNNGDEEKVCDVQVPSGYGIVKDYSPGSILKDGTIILKCTSEIGNLTHYTHNLEYLIRIKDGKQTLIDSQNQGIYMISVFTMDSKGNIWTQGSTTKSIVKIDRNNNIKKYEVEADGYSLLDELPLLKADNEGNIWGMVRNNKLTYALIKISESQSRVTPTIYGLDKGLKDLRQFEIDSNGAVWAKDGDVLKKLENDTFVPKYQSTSSYRWILNIVDDNHFVISDGSSYAYVNGGKIVTTQPVSDKPNDLSTNITSNNNGTAESDKSVAEEIDNVGAVLPQTGSMVDITSLLISGLIITAVGTGFFLRKKKNINVQN